MITWMSWRWWRWRSRWMKPWPGWTTRWICRANRVSVRTLWWKPKRFRPKQRYRPHQCFDYPYGSKSATGNSCKNLFYCSIKSFDQTLKMRIKLHLIITWHVPESVGQHTTAGSHLKIIRLIVHLLPKLWNKISAKNRKWLKIFKLGTQET